MISERTAPDSEKTETPSGAPTQNSDDFPRLPEHTTLSDSAARTCTEQKKSSYKHVPEDWKTVPPGRFTKAIGHIEAVLLDISADGEHNSNPFDWKPTISTLRAWADHLRSALKELTKQP
jgi:hypothetical protein